MFLKIFTEINNSINVFEIILIFCFFENNNFCFVITNNMIIIFSKSIIIQIYCGVWRNALINKYKIKYKTE